MIITKFKDFYLFYLIFCGIGISSINNTLQRRKLNKNWILQVELIPRSKIGWILNACFRKNPDFDAHTLSFFKNTYCSFLLLLPSWIYNWQNCFPEKRFESTATSNQVYFLWVSLKFYTIKKEQNPRLN